MSLPLDRQNAYDDFLTKLLAKAVRSEQTRQALGNYVLELLKGQADDLVM